MFESPSQRASQEQGNGWVYLGELENMASWLCEGSEASAAISAATRNMDTYRGQVMVKRWIHSLTTFEIVNRHNESYYSDLLDRAVDGRRVRFPSGRVFDQEIGTRLRVLERLCALPDNYRCALLLKEGHGLSVDKTAAVMGVSPGSLRSILYRARQSIRPE